MEPALHENLVAADRNRLFDFPQELGPGQHIAFVNIFWRTVKRTEIADRRADICVVDVSINIVRAISFWMESAGDLVGRTANRRQIV